MPYSKAVLAQASGTNALSLEMKAQLDAAIVASGKYSKVTNGYVSATRTYDVWLNDGTTDGYQWYLIVGTDSSASTLGRLGISGALEYSDATKLATKCLRGSGNTPQWINSSGYPVTTNGGATEVTYALGNFAPTYAGNTGKMWPETNTWPTAAANGNTMRVLVTGQFAWFWYGTATTGTTCAGVGTYTNIHSTTSDLKPLAYLAHNGGSGTSGGTVWQSPASNNLNGNATVSSCIASNATVNTGECYSQVVGKVGAAGTDAGYDGIYIGSRMHICRESGNQTGGGTNYTTWGWSVGLAPADFLIFAKQAPTAVGDTVTVDGKVYENITSTGAGLGVFINTSA